MACQLPLVRGAFCGVPAAHINFNSHIKKTILNENGAHLSDIEHLLEKVIGRGQKTELTPEHLTPRAKRILEKSIESSKGIGNEFVGTTQQKNP